MVQALAALANGAVLLFVVTTMLAMGFSLTLAQILAPCRHVRLVVLALVANFVLVPLLAIVLMRVIPLSKPLAIGLILLGTAAGAPFLPKLAQLAHGNVALGVGLMRLLLVASIIYLPIVLPLLLPGVSVDTFSIAVSLLLTTLLPLGLALLVRGRDPEPAGQLKSLMGQASNVALLLVLVISLLANFQELVGVIGAGGILAARVLIFGGVMFGFLLGGHGSDTRSVLGLGTGQRNVSAALLVASPSFTDPNVAAMVLVGSTLGLVVLLPLARELGRRTARSSAATAGGTAAPTSAAATGAADVPPAGTVPVAG